MQAEPKEVSVDKANTPVLRTRPTLASHRLVLPNICDICGRARSAGKHAKCSRVRQQTKEAEWAALLAEKAAAKQNKGCRYAR